MVNLTHMLYGSFKEHGVSPRVEGDWLYIDPCPSPIRGRYQMSEDGTFCRLDIQIPFSDGRLLEESFLGSGDSEEACVKQAYGLFLLESFHVLLSGIFKVSGNSAIEPEKLTRSGEEQHVYMGNIMVRSASDQRAKLPGNFLDTVKTLAMNQEMNHAFHWLRISLTVDEGRIQDTEVLWDNRFWSRGAQTIEELNWDLGAHYSSVRLFLILENKGDRKPHAPYPKSKMEEAEHLVDIALSLHIKDQIHDAVWTDLLLKLGFDEYQVFKAVRFIPEAFGRGFLKDMNLSFEDSFEIIDEQGKAVEYGRLSRDPIFRAAANVNKEKFDEDVFLLHTSKSAEVDAVKNALEAGAQPEHLKFAGMVLRGAPVSSDRPAKPEPRTPPTRPTPVMENEEKPWWKFWG